MLELLLAPLALLWDLFVLIVVLWIWFMIIRWCVTQLRSWCAEQSSVSSNDPPTTML